MTLEEIVITEPALQTIIRKENIGLQGIEKEKNMRLQNIKPIEPELAKCISVNSIDKLFAIGKSGLLTHNSVLQQNIVIGCILRPKDWIILGIDLKRVELSRFRKFGMNAATTLEDATEYLKFAQAVMMKRYEEMEELGKNNFMDMPDHGQAILLMIDECGELLGETPGKSLSENTLLKTPNGYDKLSKLSIGDTVYDSNTELTTITNKYEPDNQERFRLTIMRNTDGHIEKDTIAGSEHLWNIRIYYKDGRIINQEQVNTSKLSELQDDNSIDRITFVRKE